MNYKEITSYEQTEELKSDIKIKKQSDEIYRDFKKNVKLDVGKYKGSGKFLHWSDSNNSTSFVLKDDIFTFHGDYINNTYRVEVTPSAIFSALKSKSHSTQQAVYHLKSAVRKKD